MPDENPTPTDETNPPAPDAAKDEPKDEPKGDDTPKPDDAPKDEPKDEEKESLTPEQLRAELTRVRAEAANYRTRLRTTEDQLANAKTPEELETAVNAVKEENARLARELLVSTVARKFELPAELAEVLKGDDEAALEAHAKTLAKFAGSDESTDPKGGLNPDNGSDGFDPVKAARAARRRRF